MEMQLVLRRKHDDFYAILKYKQIPSCVGATLLLALNKTFIFSVPLVNSQASQISLEG